MNEEEEEDKKSVLGITTVPNQSINDIDDLGALGVYLYLLSQPDKRDLNATRIAEHFKCAKNRIYRMMSYLTRAGFVSKENIRQEGRFAETTYNVHLHKIDR